MLISFELASFFTVFQIGLGAMLGLIIALGLMLAFPVFLLVCFPNPKIREQYLAWPD